MEQLRAKWRACLIGGGRGGEGKSVIEHTAMQAIAWQDAMLREEQRTGLWADTCGTTDSGELTVSFGRLRQMAIAYAATDSPRRGCSELERDIQDGLRWMLQHRYHAQIQTYDNWWHWEIGAPMALNDTLLLMQERLEPELVRQYLQAVDRFVPDPATVLVSSRWPARLSTGANRVWICTVVAVRSILAEDADMLLKVRDALEELFVYSEHGDGFYADGSFIQHEVHPYTGGYGKSMIADLAHLLHLLSDTPFEVAESSYERVFGWMYEAFEPLLYRGSLMDMVSGREVSRPYSQNHKAGHMVIGAALLLAGLAPEPHAGRLRQLAKRWIAGDTAWRFEQHASPYLAERAAELRQDRTVPAGEEEPRFRMFGSMARAVYRRPAFACGISMFSKRIASYESINGEHLRGWYTGHGYVSLYNGDLTQYSDGYWPTVDPYRMAGTTVTVLPRADRFGYNYRNDSAWVGGVALQDRYGTAGMLLEDYRSDETPQPLVARKSWFMFEGEMVALGTGISLAAPMSVETVVENRKLNEDGSNRLVIDGRLAPADCGWADTLSASWLHLEGSAPGADIGYCLLDCGVEIRAKREMRTGRWSDIGRESGEEVSRAYLTLWLDHGVAPEDGRYAYALLPGLSEADTAAYAANPPVQIIAQSNDVHAVGHGELGLLGAHFWTDRPTEAGLLTCTGQAAVLLQQTDDTLEVAVSDPTHENGGAIELVVAAEAAEVVHADSRVEVLQLSPAVRLRIDVAGACGAAAVVRLRR